MKVQIGMCCSRGIEAKTAASLAYLVGYTIGKVKGALDIGLMIKHTSILPQGRQNMLEETIAAGFDYLLMIDSDMIFPADSLLRMLQPCMADEKISAVGTVYCTRKGTFGSTGKRTAEKKLVLHPRRDKGLVPVHSLGMGLFLIRCSAVKELKKPWFTFNYNPDAEVAGDRWTGEDYWFCGLLREAGIQVYCDADLSRQVQHIGEVEYKTEQIR